MRIGKYTIPQIRKAVVAVVLGLITIALSVSQIFGEWLSEDVTLWITSGIALLTAVSVFFVRNAAFIDSIGTGTNLNAPPPPVS